MSAPTSAHRATPTGVVGVAVATGATGPWLRTGPSGSAATVGDGDALTGDVSVGVGTGVVGWDWRGGCVAGGRVGVRVGVGVGVAVWLAMVSSFVAAALACVRTLVGNGRYPCGS